MFAEIKHGLRQLSSGPQISLGTAEQSANFKSETDRVEIIFQAAELQNALSYKIREHLRGFDNVELGEYFDVNGHGRDFGAKASLAKGLQIITADQEEHALVIEELRYAAVHSRDAISFDAPPVREATLSLLPDPALRALANQFSRTRMRRVFSLIASTLIQNILGARARLDHADLALIAREADCDAETVPASEAGESRLSGTS